MKERKESLYNLLKRYEGKKVRILTKFNIHYEASDLKIFENSIWFIDKVGNEVLLAISEITQLTEVKNETSR